MYSKQVRELFDKLAAEELATKEAEANTDLLTLDEERQQVNNQREELEEDRRKFTEAAVKLGKEKAGLLGYMLATVGVDGRMALQILQIVYAC